MCAHGWERKERKTVSRIQWYKRKTLVYLLSKVTSKLYSYKYNNVIVPSGCEKITICNAGSTHIL